MITLEECLMGLGKKVEKSNPIIPKILIYALYFYIRVFLKGHYNRRGY